MVQPQEFHRPPLRSVLMTYVNVTAATYTAKGGDRLIGVNRAGTVTITLPTVQVRKGRVYTIKDESGAAATNNITVAAEGSETIDGSATDVIDVSYESKSYYSDGTNWFVLPVTPDTNTQLTLATTVSTQAHGDAAVGGSATTASKGDHKHAMPAAGGPTEAAQADMEDEGTTNADRYVSPEVAVFAPSACKMWIKMDGTGTVAIDASYNVTSLTDNGTGDYNINIATDFSTANYGFAFGGWDGVTSDARYKVIGRGATAGVLKIYSLLEDATSGISAAYDGPNLTAVAFGDQ